jgi:hypothetical protein
MFWGVVGGCVPACDNDQGGEGTIPGTARILPEIGSGPESGNSICREMSVWDRSETFERLHNLWKI